MLLPISQKENMVECPYCKSTFQKDHVRTRMKKWGKDKQSFYSTRHCPNCDKRIMLRDDNPDIESVNTRLSKLRTYCNYCKMNGQFDEYRDGMSEILELQKQIEDMRNGEMDTKDAKNFMGERVFQTYEAWKRACRQIDPNVKFDGDIDICQAGKIGEWDGDKGIIYNTKDSKTKDEVFSGKDQYKIKIYKVGAGYNWEVFDPQGRKSISGLQAVSAESAKKDADRKLGMQIFSTLDSKKLMKDAASVALKQLGQMKKLVKDRMLQVIMYKGYAIYQVGDYLVVRKGSSLGEQLLALRGGDTEANIEKAKNAINSKTQDSKKTKDSPKEDSLQKRIKDLRDYANRSRMTGDLEEYNAAMKEIENLEREFESLQKNLPIKDKKTKDNLYWKLKDLNGEIARLDSFISNQTVSRSIGANINQSSVEEAMKKRDELKAKTKEMEGKIEEMKSKGINPADVNDAEYGVMNCPNCKNQLTYAGEENGKTKYKCLLCGKKYMTKDKKAKDAWIDEYNGYKIVIKEFGLNTFEFTIQKNGKDVYKGVQETLLGARATARRLIDQNKVSDSKITAKDKALSALDSLKRRVKDVFGMNIEEQQKQFDVRDIEKETIENNAFRKVLFTGNNTQLVLMSLLPNEDIGMEQHKDVDQFFRIEKGVGLLEVEGQGQQSLKNGSSILITAGTKHNVKNIGKEPLKLYTLYSPPNHPADTLQNTKAEAIIAEEK